MKEELDKKLVKTFPLLYSDRHGQCNQPLCAGAFLVMGGLISSVTIALSKKDTRELCEEFLEKEVTVPRWE